MHTGITIVIILLVPLIFQLFSLRIQLRKTKQELLEQIKNLESKMEEIK